MLKSKRKIFSITLLFVFILSASAFAADLTGLHEVISGDVYIFVKSTEELTSQMAEKSLNVNDLYEVIDGDVEIFVKTQEELSAQNEYDMVIMRGVNVPTSFPSSYPTSSVDWSGTVNYTYSANKYASGRTIHSTAHTNYTMDLYKTDGTYVSSVRPDTVLTFDIKVNYDFYCIFRADTSPSKSASYYVY